MWSFVQSKQQRWLWAVDHVTADVLAYVLDTHEDTALQLKALLAPFGPAFYTDGWGLMNGILRRGNIPLETLYQED